MSNIYPQTMSLPMDDKYLRVDRRETRLCFQESFHYSRQFVFIVHRPFDVGVTNVRMSQLTNHENQDVVALLIRRADVNIRFILCSIIYIHRRIKIETLSCFPRTSQYCSSPQKPINFHLFDFISKIDKIENDDISSPSPS